MGHLLKALTMVALSVAPLAATDATTLITESCVSGTCISGVTGILIDGQHYNVDIREGVFNDLNVAGLFPMFGSEVWAQSAALTLITFFNDAAAPGYVINDIGTNSTFFAIPFQINSLMPQNVDALISNCCGASGWQTIGVSDGTGAATSYPVFATFVACEPFPGGGVTGGCFPSPFPAPEPGTLALLGLGLFGIGLSRRQNPIPN